MKLKDAEVAIVFWRLGPYHHARLNAAGLLFKVIGVEACGIEKTYAWNKVEGAECFTRITLTERFLPTKEWREDLRVRMTEELDRIRPSVLVVPGWGMADALAGIDWAIRKNIPIVCMSESTAWDESRNPIKEWVKAQLISLFSAALVGGTPHRAYMEQLGMPSDRIFLGYDAVDNGFFETEGTVTDAKQRPGQPRLKSKGGSGDLLNRKSPYLLASARFIEKKNLPRLLRAYAMYRGKAQEKAKFERLKAINETASGSIAPWDLILLGDGHLRPELEKLRSHLGLEDCVQMPGFKQYEELPAYYALAGAFIHASTTEQWGLVVNEAMASGLPVLVSNRCGCAADLVKEGENGWTFDPTNEEQIADLMLRIASDEDARERMGARSSEIIAEWGPDRFASGLTGALQAAFSIPIKKIGLLDRLILWVMIRR
jgi:glycosyltransferase involved in cell wall biosynthesis